VPGAVGRVARISGGGAGIPVLKKASILFQDCDESAGWARRRPAGTHQECRPVRFIRPQLSAWEPDAAGLGREHGEVVVDVLGQEGGELLHGDGAVARGAGGHVRVRLLEERAGEPRVAEIAPAASAS
jgi:hypothetical protein